MSWTSILLGILGFDLACLAIVVALFLYESRSWK
jgi:hypothetical protein